MTAQEKIQANEARIQQLKSKIEQYKMDAAREAKRQRDPRSAKLKQTWRRAKAFEKLEQYDAALARSLLELADLDH